MKGAEKVAAGIICFALFASVVFAVAIAYVAVHFLSKVW